MNTTKDTEPVYALYPGTVRSKNDGDRHYIGPMTLCVLYGVDLRECIIIHPGDDDKPYLREKVARAAKLIPLVPRYDGNYTIPKRAEAP